MQNQQKIMPVYNKKFIWIDKSRKLYVYQNSQWC